MCQICIDYVKGQKSCWKNTYPCKKKTLRSEVKVVSESWMYGTHRLMGLDPCAKYDMPMSKQSEVTDRTRRHVKKPINSTLKSKVNVLSGSWMCVKHRLMVIVSCSNVNVKKKVTGRTWICTDRQTDKRTDRRTDRLANWRTDIPSYITSFTGGGGLLL